MDWNFADLFEAVADTVPDNTAIICDDRRLTFAEVDERSTRLANHLIGAGVAVGDHVGIYAYNGPEWVEAMFGIWKARAVPINVNYRYVEAELAYLFDNADLTALVHGREFVSRIDAVRGQCPKLTTFVSIEDGTDEDLATIGAVEYEAALAGASAERVPGPRSSDDLYMLYTGGTTGMPKGVMWRQEDFFHSTIGALMAGGGTFESPEAVIEGAKNGGTIVGFPIAPLMHGAAQWVALDAAAPGQHPGAERAEEDGPARGLVDGRAREGAHDQPRRRRDGAPAHRGARGARRLVRPLQPLRDRFRRRDPVAGGEGQDQRGAAPRRDRRLPRRVGDGLPGHGRRRRPRGQAPFHDGAAHDGPRRRRRAARPRLGDRRPARAEGLHAPRLLQGRGEDGVDVHRAQRGALGDPGRHGARSRRTAASRCSGAAR